MSFAGSGNELPYQPNDNFLGEEEKYPGMRYQRTGQQMYAPYSVSAQNYAGMAYAPAQGQSAGQGDELRGQQQRHAHAESA